MTSNMCDVSVTLITDLSAIISPNPRKGKLRFGGDK